MSLDTNTRIVLFGAAGLVGQNLALLLAQSGYTNLIGIDKHHTNIDVLRRLNPRMDIVEADLSQVGPWQSALAGARLGVILQAQIGGKFYEEFLANNVRATELILDACRRVGIEYLVHISSSVVNSLADDFYTRSKKAQEEIVRASGIPNCVLRPTLMFGWFDRKHLGWLSRFMHSSPVFPIPGSGRYMRQPLYVLDFCRIILRCLERRPQGDVFDITGRERVDYIDIIRSIKRVTRAPAAIVRIPVRLFRALLRLYAFVDRDPPFTVQQLQALVTPDQFDLIPWWDIFDVRSTPFEEALEETFGHPQHANIRLDF